MRLKLLLLLTTLAFLASFFVVAPPAVHAKKGDDAIGAARLAMVHAANPLKPSPRKAERTPGPSLTPRVFVIEPAAILLLASGPAPQERPRTAPDRSELMVFLN